MLQLPMREHLEIQKHRRQPHPPGAKTAGTALVTERSGPPCHAARG